MKEIDLEMYRAVENRRYIERRRKANSMTEEEYLAAVAVADRRIENAKNNSNVGSNSEIYGMVVKQQKVYVADVMPLKKYSFSDTEFWGPNNADSIPRDFYVNYMEFPPEKDRVPHY